MSEPDEVPPESPAVDDAPSPPRSPDDAFEDADDVDRLSVL